MKENPIGVGAAIAIGAVVLGGLWLFTRKPEEKKPTGGAGAGSWVPFSGCFEVGGRYRFTDKKASDMFTERSGIVPDLQMGQAEFIHPGPRYCPSAAEVSAFKVTVQQWQPAATMSGSPFGWL